MNENKDTKILVYKEGATKEGEKKGISFAQNMFHYTRCQNYIKLRNKTKSKRIILKGEGIGGQWGRF